MRYKSTLMATASGKLNGAVASHNRYGDYFRGWKKGVNPARALQVIIRGIFAAVASYWPRLTLAQRTAWEGHAAALPVRDKKMGGTMVITGNAMYVRDNVPRLQAGLARVDAAPSTALMPGFTLPTGAIPTTSAILTLSNFASGDAWQGSTAAKLLVYASPVQNPGRNFYKGPYQYIGALGGTGTVTTGTLTLPFTSPATSGSKVFVDMRATLADGRLSDSQQLAVVVGAP